MSTNIERAMRNHKNIRNMSVIAHVDHGKVFPVIYYSLNHF